MRFKIILNENTQETSSFFDILKRSYSVGDLCDSARRYE